MEEVSGHHISSWEGAAMQGSGRTRLGRVQIRPCAWNSREVLGDLFNIQAWLLDTSRRVPHSHEGLGRVDGELLG